MNNNARILVEPTEKIAFQNQLLQLQYVWFRSRAGVWVELQQQQQQQQQQRKNVATLRSFVLIPKQF